MQSLQKLVRYSHLHPDGLTNIIANDKIKKGVLPEDTFTFLSSIVMRHNGNCESKPSTIQVFCSILPKNHPKRS